jgi:hypothetical protein
MGPTSGAQGGDSGLSGRPAAERAAAAAHAWHGARSRAAGLGRKPFPASARPRAAVWEGRTIRPRPHASGLTKGRVPQPEGHLAPGPQPPLLTCAPPPAPAPAAAQQRLPLDVQSGELPVLPLSIPGAVSMTHAPDTDVLLSGDEFFIFKVAGGGEGAGKGCQSGSPPPPTPCDGTL